MLIICSNSKSTRQIGGAMKSLTISILIILAILIFLLAGCAHHQDRKPWDAWDKALYGGLVAGSIADIASTDYNTSNGHEEQNPICGDGKPQATIPLNIAVLIAAYYFTDYLNPEQRKWFLGVSNVLRWTAVGINLNAD